MRATTTILRLPSRPRSICTPAAQAVPIPSPDIAPSTPNDEKSFVLPAHLRSRRRLAASPLLQPEAVALSPRVQNHIDRLVHAASASPRDLRKAARGPTRASDAGATASKILRPVLGKPKVAPTADYEDPSVGLAALITAGPQALAAATHVMTEVARCRPQFRPRAMVDFGAGVAPAVSAAGRAFREGEEVEEGVEDDGEWGEVRVKAGTLRGKSTLSEVVMVDKSPAQRELGSGILKEDAALENVAITALASMRDVPRREGGYDVVSASFALSDVVRHALSRGDGDSEGGRQRGGREAHAEKSLKKAVKDMWRRVAPGGVLVIVEHGTLAGFETVLFARDLVLRNGLIEAASEGAVEVHEADEIGYDASSIGARVVAPCLHSKACPLESTATRARVCRFVQRLNRPLSLRNTVRNPEGFEDTKFTYIVLERPAAEAKAGEADDDLEGENLDWGRIVRPPLRRGKHVVMDVCTSDGTLERRVSSKKNGEEGMYAIARKIRWGDVWPKPAPRAKRQTVHF